MDGRLRAVIADDDPFARRVVKDVLERAGVIVVAEARDGRQAVELTLHHLPDVTVMDVVMPGVDGIVATRQIRRQLPEQLVIVLTGAGSDDDELGLLALRAGAAGFLSKELEIEVLPRALEALRHGQAVISRKLTLSLIERLRGTPSGSSGMRPVKSPLTAREWEVIDLLKESKTPTRSRTSSCSRPRPSAHTSRTSCASSRSARARRPSPWPTRCARRHGRTNAPSAPARSTVARTDARRRRSACSSFASSPRSARWGEIDVRPEALAPFGL